MDRGWATARGVTNNWTLLNTHTGSYIFSFLKKLHPVFHSGCTNLITIDSAQGFIFLPTLVNSYLFNDSQSNRYEVLFHGFNLHFPDN